MGSMFAKHVVRCGVVALLISTPVYSGCLALSFGGKTEMTQPTDVERISKLEARLQNVERLVGIQSPPEEVRYASNQQEVEANH